MQAALKSSKISLIKKSYLFFLPLQRNEEKYVTVRVGTYLDWNLKSRKIPRQEIVQVPTCLGVCNPEKYVTV